MKKLLATKYTIHWDGIVEMFTDDTIRNTILSILQYIFQSTLYAIWKERNRRRHDEAHHPTRVLIQIIDNQVRKRISSIQEMVDNRYEKYYLQGRK